MRKKIFYASACIMLVALVFLACKKEDEGSLRVGFANESGTGANPDNTTSATTSGGNGSTTSGGPSTTGSTSFSTTTSGTTTSGSTTSTTSGTTTSSATTSGTTTGVNPPPNNWFMMNGVTYNCTVTNPNGPGSWIIFATTGSGDTCIVSFTSLPAAGNYTVTPSIPSSTTCVVGTINSSGLKIYGMSGTATISVVSSVRRRVVFNLTDCLDNAFGAATMSGDLTTP